jgi:hypothetical protein
VEVAIVWLNLIGYFLPIVPPFADSGLSRRLTWSASGDEREKLKRVITISLERLQYIRWVTAGHTQMTKTMYAAWRRSFNNTDTVWTKWHWDEFIHPLLQWKHNKYYESVLINLLIQHAMRMHLVVVCGLYDFAVFYKRHDCLEKTAIEHNMCISSLYTNFVSNISYFSRVRFPMVSLEFFIDIIPSAALWPCGRLSL